MQVDCNDLIAANACNSSPITYSITPTANPFQLFNCISQTHPPTFHHPPPAHTMALDLHKKALSSTKYKVKPLEITEDIVNSKYYKDPLQLLGEKNFGRPRKIPKDEIGTPIQEFFRDASVFVTGGTGFMGKILVEKLLRAIPHLKHIYLLVRPKKGKAVQERLEAIFEDRVSEPIA